MNKLAGVATVILLASLVAACGSAGAIREEVQAVTNRVSTKIIDEYCAAAPGSAREEVRARLGAYFDDRLEAQINCGE